MDKVAVDEHEAVALDAIAPGVYGLRIVFVNVFGVRHADVNWTLIDVALPLSAGRIRRWAEETFGRPPEAIMLTHGHFDHVSAAKELADGWDVPVYAHALEMPYLSGKAEYPAPDVGAGGGLMTLLSPLYPRSPIDLGERLRVLPEEGVLPGWTTVHTPGHTAGHCSFFREEDRTLLAGDAFCTTKPESFFEAALAQHTELHGPPAYFTSDWEGAKASVRKLAELRPFVVAPGHGQPLEGPEVANDLAKLAAGLTRLRCRTTGSCSGLDLRS